MSASKRGQQRRQPQRKSHAVTVNGNVPPKPAPQAEQAQLDMIEQAAGRMEQNLHDQVAANKQGLAELNRRGIKLDPAYLLDLQIQSLRRSLAGTMGAGGQLWELHSRLEYEKAIAAFIQHAQSEGTKATLAMAGSLSAAAIRDLARATGTYGG